MYSIYTLLTILDKGFYYVTINLFLLTIKSRNLMMAIKEKGVAVTANFISLARKQKRSNFLTGSNKHGVAV